MSVVKTIEISGYKVNLIIHPLSALHNREKFTGQKIMHPYKTKNIIRQTKRLDKHKKEVLHEVKEMVYEDEFVPEAVDDMVNAVSFEMKHDGSCGYIFWDIEGQTFVPYARYDIKKDQDGKFKSVPSDAIPCEPMPENDDATHWPHFVPCNKDPKAYKWYIDAFNKMMQSGKLVGLKTSFTCEYMGKKFNYKPCDGVEVDAAIIPHGLVSLEIPIELRTPLGFKQILEAFDFMEGLVVYGKTNVWKIRRELFHNGDEKFKWPTTSTEKVSEKVMLV
jgi:hypothetical protein